MAVNLCCNHDRNLLTKVRKRKERCCIITSQLTRLPVVDDVIGTAHVMTSHRSLTDESSSTNTGDRSAGFITPSHGAHLLAAAGTGHAGAAASASAAAGVGA